MSERPTLPKILFVGIPGAAGISGQTRRIIRIEQGREFHPMVWVAIGMEDHHWEECALQY